MIDWMVEKENKLKKSLLMFSQFNENISFT